MRALRCLPSPPNLSSAVCCVMGREQAKIRASHLDFPSYTGGGFEEGTTAEHHFGPTLILLTFEWRREGTVRPRTLCSYFIVLRLRPSLCREWILPYGRNGWNRTGLTLRRRSGSFFSFLFLLAFHLPSSRAIAHLRPFCSVAGRHYIQ
jgi:hypothetical protein